MHAIRMISVSLLGGLLALPACQRTTPTQPQTTTAPTPAAPAEPAPATATPAPAAGTAEQQPVAGHETDLTEQLQIVQADGTSVPLENPSRIMQIETQLLANGVNPGAVDGRADVSLITGLRQFQAQKGLPQSGKLDARTASALGVSAGDLNLGDIQPVSGSDESSERLRRAAEHVQEGLQKGAEELTKPQSGATTPAPIGTTPSATEAPAHTAPVPPPVTAPIPVTPGTTATPQTQSPSPSPGQPANQPQTEGRY